MSISAIQRWQNGYWKKMVPIKEQNQEVEITNDALAISYEEALMNTDPMIGMGDITPYDFMEEQEKVNEGWYLYF